MNRILLATTLAVLLTITTSTLTTTAQTTLSAKPETPPPSAEPDPTSTATPPTPEQLANMAYEGVRGRSFVLEDGRFEGEPFVEGGASRLSVELLDEMTVFGDLDGDDVDDAAVLLVENSGGSGTRIWLCAVSARYGAPASYGCTLVGDRPQIRSMDLGDDGWVRLDVVDGAPGDPKCCPTRLWKKEWAVVNGKLIQISAMMGGKVSLAEFANSEWVLTHFDHDDPAPPEPEITLRFESDRLAGNATCNGYFANVNESAPGTLEIGPAGATRKMCPPEIMTLEQRYLERLGQVTRYGFQLGKLALSWNGENGSGTLLFKAR